MGTLSVDNNTFELVANSHVHPHDWVVQLSPENASYFESLRGQSKTFRLHDDSELALTGYVLATEVHAYNMGQQQLQVQIRRVGW
jgi:hypothetical protein